MDKEQIKKALEELNKQAKKRNFSQSYDLIINLKHLNIKSEPVDFFITLPHPKPKKPKIAAFVAQELSAQAGEICDLVIKEADFPKYADKKTLKKLVNGYDYFIAQANLMPKVAQVFGKILGIKGKMPNPKLGCVVPPNANLAPVIKKLQSTVKLSAKKATNLQCLVGNQSQPEDQVIDNILHVYQQTVRELPQHEHNLKTVQLKLTMSKPVNI